MRLSVEQAPWLGWPEVRRLAGIFAAGDIPLRFVGGAVRDALLDRPPHEVDAATPQPPGQVVAMLESASVRVVPTGLKHGTVTAVLGERSIEITTLRTDVETDGRHATVAFTADWDADARRRDFTMNALYCDPDGALHDPTGSGIDDARAGRIRFIGDPAARIREDGLRILRFFRFHAQLGIEEFDPAALEACARYASMLTALSGERVRGEMLKLLAAGHPCPAIRAMRRSGVWDHVWPKTPFDDALRMWPQLRADAGLPPDPYRAMALLLPPGAEDALDWITVRWKLSNAESARLSAMLACTLPPGFEAQLARILYRCGQEPALVALLRVWAEALHEDPASRSALRARYAPLLQPIAEWQKPVFPLAGADLVAHGIEPGRAIGIALRRLEEHWVEADFRPDRDALLALL